MFVVCGVLLDTYVLLLDICTVYSAIILISELSYLLQSIILYIFRCVFNTTSLAVPTT